MHFTVSKDLYPLMGKFLVYFLFPRLFNPYLLSCFLAFSVFLFASLFFLSFLVLRKTLLDDKVHNFYFVIRKMCGTFHFWAENSCFSLKSTIFGIVDSRLSRKTCEMCAFQAFHWNRKIHTRHGNSSSFFTVSLIAFFLISSLFLPIVLSFFPSFLLPPFLSSLFLSFFLSFLLSYFFLYFFLFFIFVSSFFLACLLVCLFLQLFFFLSFFFSFFLSPFPSFYPSLFISFSVLRPTCHPTFLLSSFIFFLISFILLNYDLVTETIIRFINFCTRKTVAWAFPT